MGSGSSKKAKKVRDLDDYDDYDSDYESHPSPSKKGGSSPSHSYYEGRHGGGGRRSRLSNAPSELTIRTSYTDDTFSRAASTYTRAGSAGKELAERRKRWAKETAKRIHVVVRVRPLNVREIKAGEKVRWQKRKHSKEPSREEGKGNFAAATA